MQASPMTTVGPAGVYGARGDDDGCTYHKSEFKLSVNKDRGKDEVDIRPHDREDSAGRRMRANFHRSHKGSCGE